MKRFLYEKLNSWKGKQRRKPLLLRGARQVGKTHLLKEFGDKEFANYHYLNFEKQPELAKIFDSNLDTSRILNEISLRLGRNVQVTTDLLIFDEIQACPKAITALKYFCEDKPELAVCAAGSLLGVMMSSESFPVGKVEFLDLYPMTFSEFLLAKNKQSLLAELENAVKTKNISLTAHTILWEHLKEYYVVGGMPEIVSRYVNSELSGSNLHEEIRAVQHDLIDTYYKDFAKHAGPINAMHIAGVFENVPRQLAQNIDDSVRRYRFKDVLPNKRSFTELSGPIDWLVRAGLLIQVKITEHVEIPLEAFCQDNFFKLYLFDVGLLGCLLDLNVSAILDEKYGIIKGYFSENFVATQLIASTIKPLYAWNKVNSKIEFIVNHEAQIIPIEVKAGHRTQAKSLSQYIKRYQPKSAFMITGQPMQINSERVLQKIALYQAEYLKKIFL